MDVPVVSVVLAVSRKDDVFQETVRRIRAYLDLQGIRWELVTSATVAEGVSKAAGETVVVTDVGLTSPIKEYDKLFRAIQEGADVAVGMNDKACGPFAAFKRPTASRLFGAQAHGLSDALRTAQKEGLTIRNVPVMWRHGGTVYNSPRFR